MYDFYFLSNHLHGQPRLNSMISSPRMLLWGVCFIPARLDIRQIKGVKRQKQSGGVISPQAPSLSVNTPRSSAFANNVTSPLRQTISYDTVSAASPVTKMISGCTCVWAHVNISGSRTASDWICLLASLSLSLSLCAPKAQMGCEMSLCVFGCVHIVGCLMVCVIMRLQAAGPPAGAAFVWRLRRQAGR